MIRLIDARTWEVLAEYEEPPEEIVKMFEDMMLMKMGIIIEGC